VSSDSTLRSNAKLGTRQFVKLADIRGRMNEWFGPAACVTCCMQGNYGDVSLHCQRLFVTLLLPLRIGKQPANGRPPYRPSVPFRYATFLVISVGGVEMRNSRVAI
jgi:hypothetical protein